FISRLLLSLCVTNIAQSPRLLELVDVSGGLQPAIPYPAGQVFRGALVGGRCGQSLASRKASISSFEKTRPPLFIPWQRWAECAHASGLARLPSQNGQVRHWSGRKL